MLGIRDLEGLLAHPVVGRRWEGFVIETLIAAAPQGTQCHFYRTSAGAEEDLLLTLPDGARWAIEIKRSARPRPERGFHHARGDLEPDRAFVVYPGRDRFAVADGVEAVSIVGLGQDLLSA